MLMLVSSSGFLAPAHGRDHRKATMSILVERLADPSLVSYLRILVWLTLAKDPIIENGQQR